GWATLPTPKLRPPTSASAMGLPGGVSASPTITTSESATPGAAMAATIALPGATPMTSPVLDTVATLGVRLLQVASEDDSGFPAMSVTTAVSCAVFPGLSVVSVTYPGLTRTAAGAVSGATVSRTVSTPAYSTALSLERMPSSVTSNGWAFPTTTTGTVSVALPAASTGTVVSPTARPTPVLEIGTTRTWSWSRSCSRTVPVPVPMAISGTIDNVGPPSSDPAHSAHATMPLAVTSVSPTTRRRIIAS